MTSRRSNSPGQPLMHWNHALYAIGALSIARIIPRALREDAHAMLMRKLGRTGLNVAALCLGGNTFGWTTDQKASEAVLDAYMDAGGNFIDTADVYSRWAPGHTGGESETALGVWMAARKNRHAVIM